MLELEDLPGKTPAKPSAFSMSSSTGSVASASSFVLPSKDEDGYMFVPIPNLLPVSFAIANWSPVIILTLTPRSRALLIVSALSCRGGSNKGRRPTNSHGPPGLSLVPSGTSYSITVQRKSYQYICVKGRSMVQ